MAYQNEEDSWLKLLKRARGEQKKKLIADFEEKFGINSEQIRERKHDERIPCPNSECVVPGQVVKYGSTDKSKSRQRYLCKACDRHFNDHTGTFFQNRKLRNHIVVFLQCMFDGLTIRQIARQLEISPTTAHTWRKTILHAIEKNWDKLGWTLGNNGVIETSVSEVKPSRKGLPKNQNIPATTQVIKFRCDRSDHYEVSLLSAACYVPDKQLKKTSTSFFLNKSVEEQTVAASSADRILLHSHHIKVIGERFDEMYRKMRGVAQPYLLKYARWQLLLVYLDKLSFKERLRYLQLMSI